MDLEIKEAVKFAQENDPQPCIWIVGVSEGGVSVVEDGILRYFLLTETKPTPTDISNTVLLAMNSPIKDVITMALSKKKPEIVAFNQLSVSNDSEIKLVASLLDQYKVSVKQYEQLTPNELKEITKRKIEQKNSTIGEKPDFQQQPPRVCYSCRQQIVEKRPSQCSACKAIIYCSAQCAKNDWPQHKGLCPLFKGSMKLVESGCHDFDFSFYSNSNILQVYNAVILLIREGLHNVGLYRRICHCYDQVPFGELHQELDNQMENLDKKAAFDSLFLSEQLNPLSAPIVSKVDSWKSFYKEKKLDSSSLAALVLDYPLTVYYMLKYWFPTEIPKKLEIHLVGSEQEADLIPAFEILLGLLNNCAITIKMIGPAISNSLQKKVFKFQNENSSLVIELISSLYTEQLLNLKPDAIMLLNPGLLQYETWLPTMQLFMKTKTKFAISDIMEPNLHVIKFNLLQLGAQIDRPFELNPFRQPVHRWSPDCNFPGWSNGFLCVVNA